MLTVITKDAKVHAITFPFLIGRMLTVGYYPVAYNPVLFPFLIGRMLTSSGMAYPHTLQFKFPFLIGRMLTRLIRLEPIGK